MALPLKTRQIDRREWWLWGLAVVVTIALAAAIIFLTFFSRYIPVSEGYWADLHDWVRGLVALVLLFDIYTMYQHRQLQRIRRQLAHSDELFHLISENAADMIAVVDGEGHRLYNSPAYTKVLGYTPEELASTVSMDQIHPEDRARVIEAAAKARATGRGERLEYRMQHRDGSWRILESTASPIEGPEGEEDRLVVVNRDITDRKRAEDLLAHNAFHDGLTGLPNRFLFIDRLRQAMRTRMRRDARIAVLLVDVDEFKVVNDSLGHSAGDKLLVELSRRLLNCATQVESQAQGLGDIEVEDKVQVARFGGDEFIVLLEDVSGPADAIRIAQKIQEGVASEFVLNDHKIVIAASIGIALTSGTPVRPEDLLRDAELAMYRAKRTGKARYEVFDPALHSSAIKRLTLESDLRRGVENGELVVFYQPIVSLATGKIAGFEALSRWRRADGLVPPVDFIPVAEETGLIVPINHALMLDSCRQLKEWQRQFPCDPPLAVSMNVTQRQFEKTDLVEEVRSILEQSGAEPRTVHFEITETVTMQGADRALARLSQLKALGVHLSIDDFGTGFSSLSRLRRFPLDALKIDRVFISAMGEDEDSFEIVRLIITLAHTLGLQVVGEGTETEAQVAQLKQLGCEMAQGYLYSPPVPPEQALTLLQHDYPANPRKELALGAHA
ncbi:MAG TPA: EAL domain-containing protein [Terriglobales bacterium]